MKKRNKNYDKEYKSFVKKSRFSVFKERHSEDKKDVVRYAIVLKDKSTGLFILMTDFADYGLYCVYKDDYAFRTNENSLYAICDFLNYVLLDKYEKYGITSVEDLTVNMVKDYLDYYSKTWLPSGRFPSKQSVYNHRAAVSIFVEMLCKNKKGRMKNIKEHDLIGKEPIISGGRYKRLVSDYKIKVKIWDDKKSGLKDLFRDMPLQLAERFISYSEIYDPELTFAIVLMLYAGLRQGEVCHVFRGNGYDICYRPNHFVSVDENGNKIIKTTDVTLNLNNEYTMRSDFVRLGEIKRERPVQVNPSLVPIVDEYYQRHIKLISDKPCESYMPMFMNKQMNRKEGVYMAMTKSGLRERLKSLFYRHVLPSCENDEDPELCRFYQTMQNHSWGGHSFRHWFTIMLLTCCDIDSPRELADYRGDKSEESAFTYIQNKGPTIKHYKESLKRLGQMIRGENNG